MKNLFTKEYYKTQWFSFQIFENTALKHGKVNLTWDETDPNRVAAMRKAFEADSGDEEDEDVKAYLANSSDDDDEVGLAPFGEEEELGKTLFLHFLKFCC